MNTWAVRNKDGCAFARIAVFGEFGNGIEFGMLNFRACDQLAVDFHLATIVITRWHPVPTKRNDGMVFDNDTTDLESLGVAALRRKQGDLHVHLVVFLNIHDEQTKSGTNE